MTVLAIVLLIATASEYKRSKGMVYKTQLTVGKPLWTTAAIDKILKNRLYTGDMVQGRRRVKSYKIHEIENIPESEWIIVENTHEPIIEKQTLKWKDNLYLKKMQKGGKHMFFR